MAVTPLDLPGNIYLSRWLPPKEQSVRGPPSLPTLILFSTNRYLCFQDYKKLRDIVCLMIFVFKAE